MSRRQCSKAFWAEKAVRFLAKIQGPRKGLFPSTPNGPVTLHGTIYGALALHYLSQSLHLSKEVIQFVREAQDPRSGLFVGPEFHGWQPLSTSIHDFDHLILHQTSAVLPFLDTFRIKLPYPLRGAEKYCEPSFLREWLSLRNFKSAWLEGNNLLFIGQILVYLRDVERHPAADAALQLWFDWLDDLADPETGLWGTNGECSNMEAVYGGYHQLLVYFHERHPIPNAQGVVNTVLALQHTDGGFNPNGNAGACEDVDSVDILVNCYKRFDYRRSDIRRALRRCLRHILATQNTDGGFPYNRDQPQSHMGIPGTEAGPNVSCTFPTWFRIHTLALIGEVLPSEPLLQGINFRFNRALSMGWHSSPLGWAGLSDALSLGDKLDLLVWRAAQSEASSLIHFRKLYRLVRQRANFWRC